MKNKILVFVFCVTANLADDTADTKKIDSGKVGVDIKIGLNQASTGAIFHITSWLAINPFIVYRNQERSSNSFSGLSSSNVKDEYYGGGAFIPFYIARVENLYIKLLPGFSYMKGTYSEQYLYSPTLGISNYTRDTVTTRYNLQLFLGLQYAITKHLHVIGETGLNYTNNKYADAVSGSNSEKLVNFYSGNIGLIFYFN